MPLSHRWWPTSASPSTRNCRQATKGNPMRGTQARILAEYNRWMNDRLYAACAELSDNERKQDRQAFFASIHGTLNHLLLGDRLWMGRFVNRPFAVDSLAQQLYEDFAELSEQRRLLDQEIIDWAGGLSDEALAAPFSFRSTVNPAQWQCPLWVAVTHFFNHQTHHRGQLTTLLSQSGVDYGTTDLIWLPEVMTRSDNA